MLTTRAALDIADVFLVALDGRELPADVATYLENIRARLEEARAASDTVRKFLDEAVWPELATESEAINSAVTNWFDRHPEVVEFLGLERRGNPIQ